jgi:hypothetical protein
VLGLPRQPWLGDHVGVWTSIRSLLFVVVV